MTNLHAIFALLFSRNSALGPSPTKDAILQPTYHPTYEVFHTPTNHLHYLNPIEVFPQHINGVIDESGIFVPLLPDGNLMRHPEIVSYDPYEMETAHGYRNSSQEVPDQQQPSCSSTPNNTGSTPSTTGSSGKSAGASSKKRGCFPKNATNKLKHWLFQNLTVCVACGC